MREKDGRKAFVGSCVRAAKAGTCLSPKGEFLRGLREKASEASRKRSVSLRQNLNEARHS